MSAWGMNDGSALTGTITFTNDSASVLGNADTVFKTELSEGDVLVGADGKLYRVTKRSHARAVATSAVTAGTNTFTLASHGFATGDEVTYKAGGGTVAAGLTDNATFFIIKTDANDFKLAATAALAAVPTPIGITGTGNNAQNFESVGACNTACTVDRVYDGTTAAGETVTVTTLPRNLKVTTDAGVGHSLSTLGVFGFSGAEAMAGGDDVVTISSINNAYSGGNDGQITLGGAGYKAAPTVTVTAPTTRAFNAASAAVVIVAADAIILADPPTTGTKLVYQNFPSVGGTASGAVVSGITNNQTQFARTANSTAVYLYASFAQATANNGIGKPAAGLRSLAAVSGTSGNHMFNGVTSTSTAVIASGRVTSYTMTETGSDYTSDPVVTIAAQAHNFNAATAVAANGEITISAHTFVVGDRVQYSDGGGTKISELTDDAFYFITEIASNKLYLAAAKGGSKITLTDGPSQNHTLAGEAAAAVTARGVGRGGDAGSPRARDMMGAHTGWVKRTVGTGGRAGRVHYESLVAASSITGDGEDLATPDE